MKEDNYTCQQCGKQPGFKLVISYGCILMPDWKDKHGIIRHPSFCPIKNEIGLNEVKQLTAYGYKTVTIPKISCGQCENFCIIFYEDIRKRLLTVHHKNNNPKDNRRPNLETVCLSCNLKKENKEPTQLEVDKMLFGKKDEKEATLENLPKVDEKPQVVPELKPPEQKQCLECPHTKTIKAIQGELKRLRTGLFVASGATNGKQTNDKIKPNEKSSNNGNINNVYTRDIHENTSYKNEFDRKALREIKAMLSGKKHIQGEILRRVIGNTLKKNGIGYTINTAYLCYLVKDKTIKRDGRSRYKIFI